VTAPVQAAPGRVRVAIENALGLERAASELVVLPEPGYVAHDAALAKRFGRITLDPERRAVLLAGSGTEEIHRFRLEGGAWAEDALPVANANAVAVTVDGRNLLASAGGTGAAEVFRRLDPVTLAVREATQYDDFFGRFDIVAGLNDGRTLIVDSDQWPEAVWYPELARGPFFDTHTAMALLTRDRSRLVLHGTGTTPGRTSSLDASEESPRSRSIAQLLLLPAWWSISGDGGRLIAYSTVHDRDFAALGSLVLPEPDLVAVAASPDGAFAYTAARTSGGTAWVFRRTDVRAASGPYTADATALPLSLPIGESPVAMEVSDDGGTLFVLTNPTSGTGSAFHAFPLP